MYLTAKDQLRIDIITKYLEGQIHREHAQIALEIGERQFRRVIGRFKEHGVLSLKHGNCGSTPKNKIDQKLENKIVSLAKGRYAGFNMVHFREKIQLEFPDRPIPSYSTFRRIFTEHKLIRSQKKRSRRPHRSRNRYEREGIMLQIDGSFHIWFGTEATCLIAAIDDATGKILGAKFSPTETTFDTMDVVEDILRRYGRFHLLYSDKAGIYDNAKREGFTNLTRALNSLEVASVLSSCPEARGRIERLWRTLQDRLISELKLRNIQTMEEANRFLSEFIVEFNQRFSVLAASPIPAYRPIPDGIDLNEILCKIEQRTVGSGHTITLDHEKYVIKSDPGFCIKRRPVEVRTYRDQKKKFFIQNIEVQVEKLEKVRRAA